jgi:uncharacterized integral membrane protein
MKIFNYLALLLRGALLLFFLLFAAKNLDTVTLQFFLGQSWQLPLALLLFIFFFLGVALALLASLGRVFSARREVVALRRQLDEKIPPAKPPVDVLPTPPSDAVE